MTRDELVKRIRTASEEMQIAGKIHRRDLFKHIKRMKKELREYDRYQAESARG